MKDCYCFNCNKEFHHLGIASHRAVHRRAKEDCKIMYSDGTTKTHGFSRPYKNALATVPAALPLYTADGTRIEEFDY